MISSIAIKGPLRLVVELCGGTQTLSPDRSDTLQRYHNRALDLDRSLSRGAAIQSHARARHQLSFADVRDKNFRHVERLSHFDLGRWGHRCHASSQFSISAHTSTPEVAS